MHRTSLLLILALCAAPVCAKDFSGERALDYTRQAVAFGPRPIGSPALHKLETLIRATLKTTGCQLTSDDFTGATPNGPVAMHNLVCRFPGTSGKAIAITGHYDTKILPHFVGANDGGSSTGFLLELAKSLQGQPRKDDVLLVFFDGEEAVKEWTATDSLYGSRQIADKWQSDGTLARLKGLINIDMIGDKDLELIYDMSSSAAVRSIVWDAADRLGYSKSFPRVPGGITDDHVPFLQHGVRAVDLIDFDYGPGNAYWHTPEDTMDKLSAHSFTVIGKVVVEAIHQLELTN
jgi:glutaminyl-peptide cyclotransferase